MTTRLTELYHIADMIDTFALGHYARVVSAIDQRTGQPVAFKIMRPEHLTRDGDMKWEFKAFPNEADLLMRLSDSPHVIRLLDCGYLESTAEVPEDGDIVSFGTDIATFAMSMQEYANRGWRPYLGLEELPRTHNLLYVMKPNQPGTRWRLPTEEGLALAIQFADFLQTAHQNKVVYLDHKLEHVYWDGERLRVIDLNSSRLLNNESNDAQQFRTDIHNFCVGILYPIFTGISAVTGGLRATPSSMAEVEARYRDVNLLDFGVEPTLSPAVQEVIQRGASMEYADVADFLMQLQYAAALHGWDTAQYDNDAARRQARDNMRTGLQKLRQGQDAIREARDILRDTLIVDGISTDQEHELRRLVKAVNAMLNARIIP